MPTLLRVAAAQIGATADPVANLALAAQAAARAADQGAALVAFPEATMACFGTDLRQVAQPLDGPFADGLRAISARHGALIVAGMFTPAPDGRVHNTLLAVGPDGEASYRKIHLFDAFGARESATVAPGRELVTFPALGAVIGLATCYDVRFADQFTALGRAGAQLVVLPASWAAGPGKDASWDLLTRARAADAQAWLLGCDQAWAPPRGSTPLGVGRSVVVDPMGQVRAQLGHEPGLLVVDVDLAETAAARERVPILALPGPE
jgi:predicted amidohydrolase